MTTTPKILHLSTALDGGGAARATSTLHQGLCAIGQSSQVLTAHSNVQRQGVERISGRLPRGQYVAMRELDKLLTDILCLPRGKASLGAVGYVSPSAGLIRRSDIVNIHWIWDGFLSLRSFNAMRVPKVVSLYDLWFTQLVRHYPEQVVSEVASGQASLDSGLKCPEGLRLPWLTAGQLSYRKARTLNSSTIFVAPSTWSENEMIRRGAKAENIRVIPHAVDDSFFYPINRLAARYALGLPASPTIFLAIGGWADRSRKGLSNLLQIWSTLSRDERGMLVLIGDYPVQVVNELRSSDVRSLGVVTDDLTLRLAYSAATAVLVPSTFDSLPLTGIEAQMCGTPIITVRGTGTQDLVSHLGTGYLMDHLTASELRAGLRWASATVAPKSSTVWERCRQSAVQKYGYRVVAERYAVVYRELLGLDPP